MTRGDREQIFAVIVPSEASLTAPIAAGVELSKLYITAAKKVEQLAQQTHVQTSIDGDGNERISVIDHPDLKWWFDQTRKIAADVAKITANLQIKEVENRIKVADMYMNSEFIDKELHEQILKKAMLANMGLLHDDQ